MGLWSCFQEVYSIQQTNDGGYIVAGYTNSKGAGDFDVWVLKLDSDGALEWDKTFGGIESDHARAIQQIEDGMYVVAGGTSLNGTGDNIWVFKLNQDGNLDCE